MGAPKTAPPARPVYYSSPTVPTGYRVVFSENRRLGSTVISAYCTGIDRDPFPRAATTSSAPPWWSCLWNLDDLVDCPDVLIEAAYGWPVRSLGWVGEMRSAQRTPRPTDSASGFGKGPPPPKPMLSMSHAVPVDTTVFGKSISRHLPLKPIWPNLLANIAVHGAGWYVLFLLPGLTRRTVRRLRHRCLRCGYSLEQAVNTGCPECGWGRE